MPDRHSVHPLPPSTPAEPAATTSAADAAGRRRALPPDLLREASRRLGIMSLLAAVLWTVGTTLGHLADQAMHPDGRSWLSLELPLDAIAASSVVVSLALFAYTRRSTRNPASILDLGLAYLILMSFALGAMTHFGVVARDRHVVDAAFLRPEISWIGAVVLMGAAIIPNSPRKIFVASLLAVSMNPIAMLLARARYDLDVGSSWNVLLMHYPDYILVGVAVVVSTVVTRLGHQVTKARELGSYRLGELLGRGGMGEVYRATHRLLARPAAIKLIRPEILAGRGAEASQVALRRFRREAEAAANLRSPHTVALYDFGVAEDETLYFVMELLDGMDLESMVNDYGQLPASRVVHLLRQVCESLEEAHAYGLVHRDVKPANIHVGRVGLRHDFVKVLDFGLVKPAPGATLAGGSSSDEHSLATAAGLTPGTPAYMAPEMVLGEPVDGRADIYALGCVAYYLLTGRLVFEADTPFQVIARHLHNEPEPPSQYADRSVPPALDQVVLQCLAKSPADRPQSASELERALAAVDVEPWGEDEAARWWAKRPRTVVVERERVGA